MHFVQQDAKHQLLIFYLFLTLSAAKYRLQLLSTFDWGKFNPERSAVNLCFKDIFHHHKDKWQSCSLPEKNGLTLPREINPLIRKIIWQINFMVEQQLPLRSGKEIIQESKDTIAVLAERYHINPKTVIKWKHRKSVQDKKCGPSSESKSLTKEQEAIAVAFRKHTKLSIEDCFYALKNYTSPFSIFLISLL